MPVPAQIRLVVGHYDEMECASGDRQVAAGTKVVLCGRVSLHRGDGHPEKIAHATSPRATTMPATIMMISVRSLSDSRNGLKPMVGR